MPNPANVLVPAASRPVTKSAIAPVHSSRGRSRAARSTGALSSQDPTAGETKTGPNSRATASTTASRLIPASHGKTVRASWQPPTVQRSSETRRRLTMTLTTIDPSISVAKTAT
jgi:hypothetical protein